MEVELDRDRNGSEAKLLVLIQVINAWLIIVDRLPSVTNDISSGSFIKRVSGPVLFPDAQGCGLIIEERYLSRVGVINYSEWTGWTIIRDSWCVWVIYSRVAKRTVNFMLLVRVTQTDLFRSMYAGMDVINPLTRHSFSFADTGVGAYFIVALYTTIYQ